MFFHPSYHQQMRNRTMRSSFGMNSVIRMNRNSAFPHHFAICRSTRPVQFQLLTIVPDIDYIYERDHYHIENDQISNLEPMYLDQQPIHNENTSSGDFYVSDPSNPAQPSRRVRYEIQSMFLRNNEYVIPIVLLDSLVGIPRAEILVLPYNSERQAERPMEDPYLIMNYLRNQNNFSQPRQVDRTRGRLSVRSEYDDRLNRYIQAPILYPQDYENYFQNDDQHHHHHRAQTPPRDIPRPRRNSYARAAGAVNVPVQDNNHIIGAGAGAAAQVRVLQLQAFTIQALISHAVKENMTCPISMNPIEQGSACVTTCQHIFERNSIQRWFQENTTCPVCRQASSICG